MSLGFLLNQLILRKMTLLEKWSDCGTLSHWGYQALNSQSKASSPTLSPFGVRGTPALEGQSSNPTWQPRDKPETITESVKEDQNVLLEYDAIFKEQIKSGIVKDVRKPAWGEAGRVHYQPYNAAIRRDKESTKLRIVCDVNQMAPP